MQQVNGEEELSQIELEINFIYHIYATVFEDMKLKDVDLFAYRFIPRCLWDNDCTHDHTCIHQLEWSHYCTSILDYIVRAGKSVLTDYVDITRMDSLGLLVWMCTNTNIIPLLVDMYGSLNLDSLLRVTTVEHDSKYSIFSKYLKVNENNRLQ